MAEDALKIRRSAKTRFTRKKNELFKAIAEKKGTEILKRKFDELTDAWCTVEGKHDIYLMYLNEEEITANEKWIEELQEEYNEASTVYIKYDNERKALELKEQEELNRQHIITLREEEFQRIVQQTIMKKNPRISNVLLAASRQGFKYCTWFISSKMYRNTEDIKNSKST